MILRSGDILNEFAALRMTICAVALSNAKGLIDCFAPLAMTAPAVALSNAKGLIDSSLRSE